MRVVSKKVGGETHVTEKDTVGKSRRPSNEFKRCKEYHNEFQREKEVKLRVRTPRLRAGGYFKMCQATLARATTAALRLSPNEKQLNRNNTTYAYYSLAC